MQVENKALILSCLDGQHWIYYNGELIKKCYGQFSVLDIFKNDSILVKNISQQYLPNKKFRLNSEVKGIEEYVNKIAKKHFSFVKNVNNKGDIMKKEIKLPVDSNGEILEYDNGYRQSGHIDNFIKDDILQYSSYSRGRSSIKIKFKSKIDGKTHSMFISDFDDFIRESQNLNKPINMLELKVKMTYVKKGANYGCKFLELL